MKHDSATEILRLAAQRADDVFGAELYRAYGAKGGDARYKSHHDDPAVEAAMRSKLAADAAYWQDPRAVDPQLDLYRRAPARYPRIATLIDACLELSGKPCRGGSCDVDRHCRRHGNADRYARLVTRWRTL